MNSSDKYLLFPLCCVEEAAPDQVSGGEECTVLEESEGEHQESNTEIRISVKQEEDELINSKEISLQE